MKEIRRGRERGDVWVGGEDTEFLTAGMVVVYFLMKGYETAEVLSCKIVKL